MNGVIAWWARNPVAANLLMVGILVAGLLAFLRMEREVWPTFRVNWVDVQVAWPGAAPQEVEEQIILRIEEALTDLDNIERIRSGALEGSGFVSIEANPKTDMNRFIADVKLRIDSISAFPRDMEPVRVREVFTRNEIMRLAVHGAGVGELALKRAAEKVRDELALLPGVSLVELFGHRREEVSVELSELAMRQYGLTFDEVAGAIRNASINASSGVVKTETGDMQIRARALANTRADFEAIIVRQSPDGGIIRVGDVARVIDGFEDVDILATLNGEPAVLVQVMTTERMDVVATSKSVREYLEKAQERLPPGVGLALWADDSKTYSDTMGIISSSALYGMVLVFLVLLATLRPKVALWVTAGIATAFAGAFVLLPANDVSLNFLSLFAFLLVLGIVVDDAIIVGESIHRETHVSGGGVDTAILATQLVAKPVLYAVLTTMVAFAPWLFLTGNAVQVTRQISIIIIAALSFSLVESLFILPAHLRKLEPRQHLGRLGSLQKKLANAILSFAETIYRPASDWAVRHRYLTAAVFLSLFLVSVGFLSSGWLKFAFDPEVESEEIIVNVTLAEGTPYSRALEILDQLQKAEKTLEEEVNARAKTGEGSGELVENWYTRSRADSVLAIVHLAPAEVRDMSTKDAADRLRELIGAIPDAKNIEVGYTLNNRGPDLQFSVNHPDLDVLRQAADALKARLATYGDVYDVRDSFTAAAEEMHLVLRPGAEQLGLSLAEISRQVRQAYFGEEVQRLPRAGSDVKVMVRYPKESRRSLDSLADFRVRTGDGREVPLAAVAEIDFAPGIKRIDRRERQRSLVVSAELKGETRHEIMADLDDNFFPQWEKRYPGVSRGAIGQAEGEAKFWSEVMSLYVVALFAMYGLIAIAFRSYFLPILVMTAIPFGFMGAVFGHLMFGMALTTWSVFGIGAAAGVVVNDNLVLVDFTNRLRDAGVKANEAIVEAAVQRFRPILLTSLTTFVGLMPMMLERATMAQFLKPTVVALAFGVAFALFVTLLFVPAMYCVGHDIEALGGRVWARVKARLAAFLGRHPNIEAAE
ncbi:MAG: efflux RND transporter permease subunit [Pseudomonadota bacterium]